ncbi:type II toxin-antitoxin system MqsA family antitoxin [Spirosoma sp. KCTC 42546]|nr:type II toxin-antitoxin system MqsA family antitoxin [Spirosoma sp. KCTC 42546]
MCGGHKEAGRTTYSVDSGDGLVVVRHVPAMICNQCGEEWIDNQTAQQLENIVLEARQKKHQLEVLSL